MENLEFKGTKGNWEFENVTTHNGDFYKVKSDNTTSICNVTTRNQEQAQANAKLIASAPAMLKALINTYLKLQILSNDNVSIAVQTDSERAELRHVISDALGIDAFDVQEYIEIEAMYQKSLK